MPTYTPQPTRCTVPSESTAARAQPTERNTASSCSELSATSTVASFFFQPLPYASSRTRTVGNCTAQACKKILCCLCALFLFTIFFAGCSLKRETLITIWTNIPEFTEYGELFNDTHSKKKVILVYKKNPSEAIASKAEKNPPDIAVGPWLRTDKTSRFFRSIDTIFDGNGITLSIFYPQLLEAGKIRQSYYLLPVSFNLPAVIFSRENAAAVEDNYTLSIEQIKAAGAAFNVRQKNGAYTRIGFAPQAGNSFLYFTAKAKGAQFREYKSSFTWNADKLSDAIAYLKNWSKTVNTSSEAERDFTYKYLSVPNFKRVTSGRTLFAYITSDALFSLTPEQSEMLDYRWIYDGNKIPIEDSFVTLGIPKGAKHPNAAYDFIVWFLSAETQRAILERKAKQNLDIHQFGIAGGFSSIKEVNEHILPLYKTMLLTNTPPTDMLGVPEKLPADWEIIKEQIIVPYLRDEVQNTGGAPVADLPTRIANRAKPSYEQ
ncbi:ABC transporter substrate-binding protein [Treponema sp. Marseille-Q4523]|uniref:ABC transporter substrate-binding protein n=1 Tax=Treponema sp. Marseille-Q4523 TaxID=2810610 RepID=UPI0019600BFD|nr:extracellular solute-binding protein [Treponema sp. Marseille-Q4523]MBM7022081.1 extracellular solute-binding protein [Treponema sp. Marseille-Q4523]